MSDLLTHWAVFDDCRRLAAHDPQMEPLFSQLLADHAEEARLGAITRGGRRWIPAILEEARADRTAPADARAGRRVAFALGGIAHFAADAVMKPLMSQRAGADWNTTHHRMQGRDVDGAKDQDPDGIREISAYYDTHVFREVYLNGAESPFNRFLLAANATAPGQELEAFVRALFQRALLSCHTLKPAPDNDLAWVDTLLDGVQPLYIDVERWVRVFTQPDPARMRHYGVETDFYRADDPAVCVARALQRGDAVPAAERAAALLPGANQGGYGRALALGMERLQHAAAYWRHETDVPPDVTQVSSSRRPLPHRMEAS